MRKKFAILLALLLLLGAACSGPPPDQTPDRPPSFEGVITAVQPTDASSGAIDVAIGDPTATSETVQRVSVANGTLILLPGTTYPQMFDQLVPQKRVRVWLDTTTSPSTAAPKAEVIELEALRPPDRPPSIEGVITAVEPYNGDPFTLDVAAGDQAAPTQSVRRVTVNNDTLILNAVTGEPLYFGELVPQRRVHVWLEPNTPLSAAEPLAGAIELQR